MATENMVKAGRAGLTFGGDWDSSVEYNRLVGVRYDNKLFFSKKPVPIGLIPEDGEFWFLAYEGLTDAEWEALLNGTQQVGDSAKLGGKDASEYALIDGFETIFISTESTEDADQKLNALHENESNRGFYVRSIDFGTTHPKLGGATGLIIGFRSNQKYGWQLFVSYDDAKQMLFRQIYNSVWTDWDSNAFASDLANYLLLTANAGQNIKAPVFTPITLHNTYVGDTMTLLGFMANNVLLGGFGFDGVDNPIVKISTGLNKLLHTGNKPSGTYTGNGVSRDVYIGGDGENVIVNFGGNGTNFAIVSYNGYIAKKGASLLCGDDVTTTNSGYLRINGSFDVFNLDGQPYRYQRV